MMTEPKERTRSAGEGGVKCIALSGVFVKPGNLPEFSQPACDAIFDRHGLELIEMPEKLFIEHRGGCGWIVLGSARRLWYYVVHTAQTAHVFGSNLEGGRSLGLLVRVAPHDRAASLGSDYGINGIFHHEHAVGDC